MTFVRDRDRAGFGWRSRSGPPNSTVAEVSVTLDPPCQNAELGRRDALSDRRALELRMSFVSPPVSVGAAPRAIIRRGTARGAGLERATTPRPARSRRRQPNRGPPTPMTVETSTWATKKGLAQMLKGGVIMDVVTPEQAKIAEDAGAVAVMALERVPADIRAAGGVARMSDPSMIVGIMDAVTIPVMAKARIGHFVEAQVLEALGVDYIDESEVLTPADEEHHIDKHAFKVPFVCGCRDLGEALRRINEGAAMIRTKGEAGTGQHRRGGAPHPRRPVRHPPPAGHARGRAVRRRQGAAGARTSWSRRSPRTASCPSSTSSPAASPRRPTRRWPCSSAPRACSSAPASSSRRIRRGRRTPSSRPRPTSITPRSSPTSRRASAAPMRGLELAAIPEAERLAVRGW